MRKLLFCSLVLCLVPLAAGCNAKPETVAETAISAAYGFITQAQANHQAECTANPNLAFPCQAIRNAVTAENLAVDALETYCGWSVPPTNSQASLQCQEAPSAKAGLLRAVANLQGVLTNYKNISGGTP